MVKQLDKAEYKHYSKLTLEAMEEFLLELEEERKKYGPFIEYNGEGMYTVRTGEKLLYTNKIGVIAILDEIDNQIKIYGSNKEDKKEKR